jgi:uncharacterized protein (TIGR02284 family)
MKSDSPAAIIETLNDLIQLDYDAVKAYEQAIERVDDHEVEDALETFLVDHERHITDLSQLIVELGGTAQDLGRDFKGVLLEGFTALRSATGTLGALKAMRTNEKLTNHTYDKALALDLPTHVRAVVAVNLDDERRHLRVIESQLERIAHTLDEGDLEKLEIEAARADRPHVRM